jgi:hypothetical protein
MGRNVTIFFTDIYSFIIVSIERVLKCCLGDFSHKKAKHHNTFVSRIGGWDVENQYPALVSKCVRTTQYNPGKSVLARVEGVGSKRECAYDSFAIINKIHREKEFS